MVAAVASLGVAIMALNRATSKSASSPAQLAALKAGSAAQFSTLKTQLGAATAALATDSAAISKLTTCVLELSGELNALSVESGYREIGGERCLTSAFLKPGKAVSSYCQPTLEPSH